MAPRELEGLTVILIEDDEDTRDVVRRLLETAGAAVRAAGSAAEGMALFHDQRPDLLLVDIAMPGEDGLSFMRRLRSLGPEQGGQTPAAALTARAVLEDRLESLKAGFQAHMAKPVPPAELIEVMATLAGR
jgi:CheY-like chemotaxis protein